MEGVQAGPLVSSIRAGVPEPHSGREGPSPGHIPGDSGGTAGHAASAALPGTELGKALDSKRLRGGCGGSRCRTTGRQGRSRLPCVDGLGVPAAVPEAPTVAQGHVCCPGWGRPTPGQGAAKFLPSLLPARRPGYIFNPAAPAVADSPAR